MKMKLCFPVEGQTVCFPIPVLAWPLHWWPEELGPLLSVDPASRLNPWKPGSQPWSAGAWIIDKRLAESAASDLPLLASIAGLTAALSEDLRGPIHQGLADAVQRIPLPAQTRVHLIDARAMP